MGSRSETADTGTCGYVRWAGPVHVVVRGGRLEVLRETANAEVYLGALLDGGGRWREALEIWVQRVESPGDRGPLTWLAADRPNALKDEEWDRETDWWLEEASDRLWLTGMEREPQPPLWIAAGGRVDVPPMRIEREAGALTKAGWTVYAASHHRVLAIETEAGTAWRELTGSGRTGADWSPPEAATVFNPLGGRIRIHRAAAWTLRDFARLVSTGQIDETQAPRRPLPPQADRPPPQRDVRTSPHLWLHGWRGARPPPAEILHLKLTLIEGALRQVAHSTRVRGRPLLNLETDALSVDWAGWEAGLALWTGQPILSQPGSARPWVPSLAADDPVFLLPPEDFGRTIYRHASVQPPRTASGVVRLREVRPDKHGPAGSLIADGTFLLSDTLPAATDWIVIRCPWCEEPLQAAISSLDLSRGEILFTTAPWIPAPEFISLRQPGATPPRALPCEAALIPRLNAPADLYSLGIIALEILCASSGSQALPRVVDETLRLAQRLDLSGIESASVPDTLAVWARKEAGEPWTECLAPGHLAGPRAPEDWAWTAVPAECWFSVLHWSLSLLTGHWSGAHFASPGEGSTLAPHTDFDRPRADLNALLTRTRAMLSMEWDDLRDIRSRVAEMIKA